MDVSYTVGTQGWARLGGVFGLGPKLNCVFSFWVLKAWMEYQGALGLEPVVLLHW